MKNQILRAVAFDGQVRVMVLEATEIVEEARRRHDSWHTATAALGRTICGTLLLGTGLNEGDRLSVEIIGDGPVGRIVTDTNGYGDVRGFVSNPKVALELNEQGGLDVGGAVGLPGTLIVRKWLGEDSEPFTGQVPLVSGEIAEDFTYYMALSEQTPSAIGLSVMVNPDESVASAGGFMIQMLPDASEEVIQQIEDRLDELALFSKLLEEGKTLEELLDLLVGSGNGKVLAYDDVRFKCNCNKERFSAGIIAVGREEIEKMIEEDEGAEVICHFCNEKYDFTKEELIELLNSLD